ncbi:hypothetical protein N7504_006288 [Penicillium tannophilum]|nr:hypothetical protein N7504_006288 [Penicillium tannophilum]
MRANPVVASKTYPSPSTDLTRMAKAYKDEADMDEDQRLFNTEEGKKLSSKERVSCATRSLLVHRPRRKEYTYQLETEVVARTNEAHETRLQSCSLYEENARLNDLACILLDSPHFAEFLNEMPDATAQFHAK